MLELKAHVLRVQKLEQSAADKAGLRSLLLDETKLLGKQGADYAEAWLEQLIKDITPEILAAAKLGKELRGALDAAVQG